MEEKASATVVVETGCFPYEVTHEGLPFVIRVKYLYSIHSIASVVRDVIPKLDHVAHGLILTAVEPPVQAGRCSHIFKIKRGLDHTIDFLVRVRGGFVSFYFEEDDGQQLTLFHKRPPQGGDGGEGMGLDGRVCECEYDPQNQSWRVKMVRTDKDRPNRRTTVAATWANIQENLGLLELFPKGSLPEEDRTFLRKFDQLREPEPWQHDWSNDSLSEGGAGAGAVEVVAPVPTQQVYLRSRAWGNTSFWSQRGAF